jgi:hypothetical protein
MRSTLGSRSPVGHPHQIALLSVNAGFVDPTRTALASIGLARVSEETLPRVWEAMETDCRPWRSAYTPTPTPMSPTWLPPEWEPTLLSSP